MENVKMPVKALASLKGWTIKELAEAADIDETHLNRVSAGYAKMTARDLINLAQATGVSPFNIKTD